MESVAACLYGVDELVLQMLFVTVSTDSKYYFLVCYNFQLPVSSSQLIDVCDVCYLFVYFQVSLPCICALLFMCTYTCKFVHPFNIVNMHVDRTKLIWLTPLQNGSDVLVFSVLHCRWLNVEQIRYFQALLTVISYLVFLLFIKFTHIDFVTGLYISSYELYN